MAKVYVKDGIKYTSSNRRMNYNSEFHDKHAQSWTLKDIIYLCGMWGTAKIRDISLALGRTEGACMTKAYDLKRKGEFNRYKKLFKQT
ncbi:hypothetical protein RBU49_11770 [Clostridium sp. MB40-C1]|uniref:hypothetical protein n=1 Tax=Clostridium sp. MB40-C1 TaxID=3070996 RepID=UPI0027DF12CC|nr:hypothetical protein [Clostridium sp. MB40-C1]WMJ79567.1 hypothetical protein RBU49_11770 [Clostridium sp. MB40-C1]